MAQDDRQVRDLTFEEIERDCEELCRKLQETGKNWKGVVVVTRGGMGPALFVTTMMDIRQVEAFGLYSYDENNMRLAVPRITKDIDDRVVTDGGAGWLVVDDLSDSGGTAKVVRDRMPHADFITVYAKPKGESLIDIFAERVAQNVWLNFPWEKKQGIYATTPIVRGLKNS